MGCLYLTERPATVAAVQTMKPTCSMPSAQKPKEMTLDFGFRSSSRVISPDSWVQSLGNLSFCSLGAAFDLLELLPFSILLPFSHAFYVIGSKVKARLAIRLIVTDRRFIRSLVSPLCTIIIIVSLLKIKMGCFTTFCARNRAKRRFQDRSPNFS